MHICHVNLARGFRGGERQTLLLIKGLALKGIEQTLICRRGNILSAKAQEVEGLNVVAIDKPFLLHSLKIKQYDLMHAHEGRACRFAFYSYLLRKKPYLITRRIPNIPGNSLSTKFVYSKATKIVCLSNAIKQNLLKYNSGLDVDLIPSMRSDLVCDKNCVHKLKQRYAGKFVIGHIGALVNHHKGQQTLIEAARKLFATHKEFYFLLLGNGQDENWLKEQAKDLSNIEFVGFVDNVGDYLSIFNLFIFPSLEEGFGSSLLDAMQFKIPIIASNVGGIPEFVRHEENGLLVEPNNSQQLVDAILRLTEDEKLAEKLVTLGSIAVDKFSSEILTDCYIDVYHQLLNPVQICSDVN